MTHGEIWMIDFGIPVGSLTGYRRPAIIFQNDEVCTRDLNTVFVVPVSSNTVLAEYKPNVFLSKEYTGLSKDSVAVVHLTGAVNKYAMIEKIGNLNEEKYNELILAINSFISN